MRFCIFAAVATVLVPAARQTSLMHVMDTADLGPSGSPASTFLPFSRLDSLIRALDALIFFNAAEKVQYVETRDGRLENGRQRDPRDAGHLQ